MPRTRRTHTKSHHGCDRCRRRRIKCDETGPPCSNCQARGAFCEFSTIRVRQSHWSESTKEGEISHPEITKDPNHANAVAGNIHGVSETSIPEMPSRTRELRLMHHWSLKTCFSFTREMGPIFQEYTVHQAFSHDFLMEALLAFTSLHLASETNGKEQALHLEEALYYQSKAVPSFRSELENINVSNCNALFACSVIMMACAAVSASFGLDDTSATGDGQKVPSNLISVFHFVRGIHSVIDKARNWLEDGPFRQVVLYDPSHSTEPTHLPVDENEVLNELRSLCPDENIYPILHHTYETAIDLLEECFKTNGGMVIPWLVLVGEEFVNQVYEEDPSALIIYTCWGAILSRLTEMWWARRAGKSIVQSLVKHLPLEGKEWRAVVTWAQNAVEDPSSELPQ